MSKAPRAIGFILDGNRRWAKENGLPTLEGHRRGMEKVREITSWAKEAGVTDVIVYAFSTENWNRAESEVSYLMDLFAEFCDRWAADVKKDGGRIRFIGQRERFSEALRAKMESAEASTASGEAGTLWIALSYGGRAEILAAVNALLAEGAQAVDEAGLRARMWSAEMPDPDLIIRTGGEERLSNFLAWQSVYSELLFTKTKLPAFSKEEFDRALLEYAERERRHGR